MCNSIFAITKKAGPYLSPAQGGPCPCLAAACGAAGPLAAAAAAGMPGTERLSSGWFCRLVETGLVGRSP
jgi:hypothetical protein